MSAHEFDGQKYKKASGMQKNWGRALINDLSLQGDETILDLGCGDGVLTELLARRVPDGQVIGIDASRGMIETAQELAGPNLEFRMMDMTALGFDQRFDVVFSNAALHWVKDQGAVLERVREILNPGGCVAFNFPGEGNCATLSAVLREVIREDALAEAMTDFEWPWCMPSVEAFRGLVESSAFDTCEVWGENADYALPDADAMIAWLDQPALVPFLAHLTPEMGRAFRESVISRMLTRTRQPDGGYFETFRRIQVRASAAERCM
jgi:trans-aconitate 2-methyltransferase